METLDSSEIRLRSGDLQAERNLSIACRARSSPEPRLPLATYLLRFFRPRTGLALRTDSESPAGAGIAGSSALMIATASALNRLTGSGHGPEKIREIAQNVEAQIIRVPTGVQDYYPALYGGVSAIELRADGVRRVAIPVDLDDFNRRIVLCYTGAPRNSGINNWEVTKAYINGDRKVQRNFGHIAAIASSHARRRSRKPIGTKPAVCCAKNGRTAAATLPGISTPLIDRLIALAKRAGSLGAKVCGAGGGGCVFFLVERGAQERVARAIAERRRRNPACASGRARCHNSKEPGRDRAGIEELMEALRAAIQDQPEGRLDVAALEIASIETPDLDPEPFLGDSG